VVIGQQFGIQAPVVAVGTGAVQPALVPVAHLQRDQDADDHDQQFDGGAIQS
jgi:hypothetical protein